MRDRNDNVPPSPERDFERFRRDADPSALGRVFDRLAPELLLVAAHVANPSTGEDLVQTTFLHAIDRAERWDENRPLMPWLIGILVKLSLREKAAARRELDPERLTLATVRDPESEAERLELAQAIAAALEGLPVHYRQVLTLRLVHGLEPAAIAHALSAPVATVKSRLQRGLARLRDALPAGLQLPAAFLVPTATLESVRDTVLSHASTKVAALTTAASTATVPLAGALLMTKLVVSAAAVAALVYLGVTFTNDSDITPQPAEVGATLAATEPVMASTESVPTEESPIDPPVARAAVDANAPVAASTAPSIDDVTEVDADSVRGRVVDEDGEPLRDVLVLCGDQRLRLFRDVNEFVRRAADHDPRDLEEEEGTRQTVTNEDGEFVFDRPDPAFSHLVVAWSGDRGARGQVLSTEDFIEIVLPIDPVVSGVVRNATGGKPIESASVQVWPATSGYPIAYEHTDARGDYELARLRPGTYRVSIEKDGFAELDTEFTLDSREEEHDLSVELEPLPELRLQLVDRAHQPWTIERLEDSLGDHLAPAARWSVSVTQESFARHGELEVERWNVQTMSLSAEGVVTGHVRLPQARTLVVWRGTEKVAEAIVSDLEAATLVVDLPERSTVELRVRVLFDPPRDEDAPIELSLIDLSGMSVRSAPIRTLTTTVSESVLPVPAQFVGTECGLKVASAGRAPYLGRLTVPAGETDVWHEVVLTPPDGVLSGVVVDANGTPLADARLTLLDTEGRANLPFGLSVQGTGIDGHFAFRELPTHPLLAMVSAPGQAARCFELDPTSGTDLRLELGVGRKFDIRMPDSIGAGQVRVLDHRNRPLVDDRLSGSMHYGGASLLLDRQAASVELYDAKTGELVSQGAVPASGELAMEPVD